jgi:hypothetical protein
VIIIRSYLRVPITVAIVWYPLAVMGLSALCEYYNRCHGNAAKGRL